MRHKARVKAAANMLQRLTVNHWFSIEYFKEAIALIESEKSE
jgi:hypothetical protein